MIGSIACHAREEGSERIRPHPYPSPGMDLTLASGIDAGGEEDSLKEGGGSAAPFLQKHPPPSPPLTTQSGVRPNCGEGGQGGEVEDRTTWDGAAQ